MNLAPAVSVVIPTHNRPQMLTAAVESALAQTFNDCEIILVLNGSAAETVSVAEAFTKHAKIRVVSIDRSTVAAARNAGVRQARGDWVAFLDDDDLWDDRKIEVQMAAAVHSDANVITCDFGLFNVHGPIAGSGLSPLPSALTFPEALMLGNFVSGGSAALVRLSAIRSSGGFDEALINCEDWDMWRRMSWNHAIFLVEQKLVRYRRHEANKGSDPNRRLIGESQHFAKMLTDTPPRLHHMIGHAKLQYFKSIESVLTAQSILIEPFPRRARRYCKSWIG